MEDSSDKKDSDDNYWTLVTRRKNNTRKQIFMFIGNIPTNATPKDIWLAVKGADFFTHLYTPLKRDRNNNRFGFLALKPHLEPGIILSSLYNIKLFGRTLGLDIARRGPPPNTFGHSFEHTSATKDEQVRPENTDKGYNSKYTSGIKDMSTVYNISRLSDLSFKEEILLSMIGITHYPDNIQNIQEKLWTLEINFITIKAITKHKFLLLFTD